MSVLGIGVDMVEIERIQHSLDRFGERFMKRVFTEGEIAYCISMKFPARHFAARFAAKEAVSKAFGTGIGKAMGWRDIDVHKKKSGEPFLVLHGGAECSRQRACDEIRLDQFESYRPSRRRDGRDRSINRPAAPRVIPQFWGAQAASLQVSAACRDAINTVQQLGMRNLLARKLQATAG